jgi:anti-sigma regulatory factor (Ser/Thr protein kinase)
MEESMAAVSGSQEQGIGPLVPAAADPGLRWRRVFLGEVNQLGVLRGWLRSLFPPCEARNDVLLIATELGTNAILHTASGRGGSFAVEIEWHQQVVRVSVTDGGAPTEPRLIADLTAETGRGLRLVQILSVDTGVYGDHRGRLVWADVPWMSADPPKMQG